MKEKLIAASCLFLLAGQASRAQAPNLSYPGPQTYTTGTPIAPLTPVNTGGTIPANIYGQPSIYPGKGSYGIAVDASGNVYTVAPYDNVVRKITPAGVVSIFAGSGVAGFANGTGTAASFNYPTCVAIDASGNLYVTDQYNQLIRKITPAGVVSTFAGSGMNGSSNGVGSAASFNYPVGIAADVSGNIIVADSFNRLIREISPAGVVTTLAGSGMQGSADGVGTAASFNTPNGVATDLSGNIYVSDYEMIRKISPTGVVTTIAGSGTGAADGPGASASFDSPLGLATDALGNVYIADYNNSEVRKIGPAGIVSTLTPAGYFAEPVGIAADASGNLYLTDQSNVIKKIPTTGYAVTPALPAGLTIDVTTGIISGTPTASAAATYTITGYNTAGSSTATVKITVNTAALPIINYGSPQNYTTGRAIYLAPVNIGGAFTNCTLSPALPAGLSFNAATGIISGIPTAVSTSTIYTLTAYNSFGNSKATVNIAVSAPVPAPSISYAGPQTYTVGVPISPLMPINKGGAVPAVVYGQVSTLAGNGQNGAVNGTGAGASFASPVGAATDLAGNVYIADAGNGYTNAGNTIRKITPAGVVTTLAGSGSIGSTNGTGIIASFNNPAGIAVDASGIVYVADQGNNLIRKITPTGVVTTLAGSGAAGAANGTGTTATFNSPVGVAVDVSGNVYVADLRNYLIRKITPDGIVSTLAGSGAQGSVDGVGTTASFSNPADITIDAAGSLYVLEGNHVRKITQAGVVSTLAANIQSGPNSIAYQSGEFLTGIAIDPTNNIYVNDKLIYLGVSLSVLSNLIKQIDSTGVVTTFAAVPRGDFSLFTPLEASLAIDTSGNLYIADGKSRLISKATIWGYSISPALPPGLKLDSLGNISGMPTTVSPTTTYTITAANSGGSSTATITIAVLSSPTAPDVTAVSPLTGITGTVITLTGARFSGATAVSFGGVPAASFTVNSATSITAVVGAGASGDVAVTTSAGTGAFAGFTYTLVLPPTNYKLTINSVTCKGNNDGAVNITAAQALNYIATIKGNGLNAPHAFTSSTTISYLPPGTYNICITVAGQPDYQQCFTAVVTEPKDLSVYSVINTVHNTVDLVLDGGTQYNIILNGTSYTTSANTISLPLNAGINNLSVTTDRLCQGTVLRTINNSGKVIPYPDPFQNTVNLNLGLTNVNNASVEIHSAADGSLVYSKQYINQSGVLALDVSNLKTGIYALKLSLNGSEKIFKIMKK